MRASTHVGPGHRPPMIGERVDRTFRRRVLRSSGSRVFVERGRDLDVTETGRIAIIAHYSPRPSVSPSVFELVTQLGDAGYRSVICSTSEARDRLRWPGDVPSGTVVLRRRNVGYDFGSWAVALDHFPRSAALDHVILTNDSIVGPFAPIAPILEGFEHGNTDAWSLTDSYEVAHHMQSYFVGFRHGVLAREPLLSFFRHVRVERAVQDVILRYELGLSATCRESGILHNSHFPADALDPARRNPTIALWERLLEQGFPFVKRRLLTDEDLADIGGPARVARAVRHHFGVDLVEWM